MVNQIFWAFVRNIIKKKHVNCKPCNYYAKNKNEVNKLYIKESKVYNKKQKSGDDVLKSENK